MHYALNCTSYNHVYRLPTSRSLKTDCTNALMMYFRSWQVDHDQIYTSIYQPSGSSIICSLWVFHSELRIRHMCSLKRNRLSHHQDLLTGNPGKFQRSRVLVCWARYCRTRLRWLCLLQVCFPPPWWEMVATGASCSSWWPPRQNKEAAAAQTWLCESNLEGCHGHQQQCFSRDRGPRIIPRLPTKGIFPD